MKPYTRNLNLPLLLLLVLILPACLTPIAAPAPGPTATALPSPTRQIEEAASPPPSVGDGQVRPSALAGAWYPGDPEELRVMVDGFLEGVEAVDGQPMAIVVPHAGYVYSGPVAAHGFKQLEGGEYDVAVIIAADHQQPVSKPISVWAEGGFVTPLGIVPVDADLAEALVAAHPSIKADTAPHQGEHPIEIELPFLQRVCPECRIVPVLMGSDSQESVAALSDALLSVLLGRRAVVIASSDLSHYPSYDDARAVDRATLAAIETGDPARVRETIDGLMSAGYSDLATCACGQGPILVASRVAKGLGADTITTLRYANSGDSPYGDRQRVVGYGAVMFWRYTPPDLTQAQRQELLRLARTTIEAYLETDVIPGYEGTDPALARRSAAFVTLKKGDELRGCMGDLWADTPLYRRVQELAVAAATSDPRFPPLTIEELDEVDIQISILSPPRRLADTREIEVGTHGLVLLQNGRQGVLLPQVPVDEGWDREEYLENLCLKAGLAHNCLADQPEFYAFTALVFGEDE
jgi:AmmeMemoRadiSam system protein B/AmmeMemoRadiSam system protein A